MKTIRIAFVGFWENFDETDNFIVNALKEKYYVQVIDTKINKESKNAVQYLFYSDFSDEYLDYNCIRIFYTGENVCPNMNYCDYAIGFDYLEMEDRYIRYPLYLAMYPNDVYSMIHKHEGICKAMAHREFCSMVVSNATCADSARREFFEILSEYKKVDSGGRYLNNIGCPDGVEDKLAFQKQYKFCIAFENSSHPGYCTEKLVQGFASQTIPIYWGDKRVRENFASDAFVNCHDYNNWDEVVDAIKKIDQNDELYMSMLQKSAVNVKEIEKQQDKFKEWIWHIVDQDYEFAYRRNLFGRCALKEEELKKERYMMLNTQKSFCRHMLGKIFRVVFKHFSKSERKHVGIQAGEEVNFGNKNPEAIFYVIRRDGPKLGLMSFFNTNLGHISYAIEKGYIPIIDMQNYENLYLEEEEMGKKNAWEYYFMQPFGKKYTLEEVYQSKHVIFSEEHPITPRPDDDMDFLLDGRAHQYWHNIYCKYSRVNNTIEEIVEEFYSKNIEPYQNAGERFLGVCLRGTDYYSLRPNAHPIQPNIDEALPAVRKVMKEWNCSKIYLVTEDEEILRAMQEEFNGRVLRFDSQIYKYCGNGFFGDAERIQRENDRYEHGKEYLCSILLLTKCNCFIGGRTSGTVGMHVMCEGFEHEHFFDLGRYGTSEYTDPGGHND